MKIVAIADTHGHHRSLALTEGDVLIHAGDFCHFGDEEHLHDFLDWYGGLDFSWKVLIGGNHDSFAAQEPEAFQALLPESVTYLNDSGVEINGMKFWGSPVQPGLVGMAFGKERGAAMKAHWDLIPDDTDVLITHSPPFGILDQSRTGQSLGCEELTQSLRRLQLQYHIFGHVHESHGQQWLGHTIFINATQVSGDYQPDYAPVVFDTE